MKSLAALFLILLFALTTVLGQEKSNQLGNIVFHAIDKKEITATATKFESKIDLESGKLTLSIPVESFVFKSTSMQKSFLNEVNMNAAKFPTINFAGTIQANSELEKDGRHIMFIKGEITIKGITKPLDFNGVLESKNGVTIINTSFLIDPSTLDLDSENAKKFSEKVEVSMSVTY